MLGAQAGSSSLTYPLSIIKLVETDSSLDVSVHSTFDGNMRGTGSCPVLLAILRCDGHMGPHRNTVGPIRVVGAVVVCI